MNSGESAGFLNFNHLSIFFCAGLFSRAISQSGSALALWAAPGNAKQNTILNAQANMVGCKDHIGKNDQLIECLRKVPAYELVNSQDHFQVIKKKLRTTKAMFGLIGVLFKINLKESNEGFDILQSLLNYFIWILRCKFKIVHSLYYFLKFRKMEHINITRIF